MTLIGSLLHVGQTKPVFCELVAAIIVYRLFVDDVRSVPHCHCKREIEELRRWAYDHEKRFSNFNSRIEKFIKKLQNHHPDLMFS